MPGSVRVQMAQNSPELSLSKARLALEGHHMYVHRGGA
jgi:hypothetical protein